MNAVTSPRDPALDPKKSAPARPRANHFALVPFALLEDERITTTAAISVYAALRSYAHFGTGEGAWPSHRRLAERARVSPATLERELNRLRDLGWIEWESGASVGGSNVYLVLDLPGNRVARGDRGGSHQEATPLAHRELPPSSQGATTERQATESHSTESHRTRNQGAGPQKPIGWSTSLGGASVDDLDYAEALCDATLQGLNQNAKVLEHGQIRPLRPEWENSLAAAKALREAGVPIGFATYFFRSIATQYRPTPKSPTIGSLKYGQAACLNAWQEEQAKRRLTAIQAEVAPEQPVPAAPRRAWSPIPGSEEAARRKAPPTPVGDVLGGFNLIRRSLGKDEIR